jgi:hypothetical protein
MEIVKLLLNFKRGGFMKKILLIAMLSIIIFFAGLLNSLSYCERNIEKQDKSGKEIYVMKNSILGEYEHKNENEEVELNLALFNDILVIHIDFNSKLCVETTDKITMLFADGNSVEINSKEKEGSCKGILTVSISIKDNKIRQILDNEIVGIKAHLKDKEISMMFSEYSLASLRMSLFCLNKV